MKIAITNINLTYLKLLQVKLYEYFNSKLVLTPVANYDTLCENLLVMEITHQVNTVVTKKIHQYKAKPVSFKLTISEAIVLQSACNYQDVGYKLEEKVAFQFVCDQVHQQITNIQL